eukprot:5364328-Pleurochrysis_carterae.AAC.1
MAGGDTGHSENTWDTDDGRRIPRARRREHQALAIILKVNITIWDRRYIGRVGAQHKQLYVCSPQGQTYIKNVTQAAAFIQQSEYDTMHVLLIVGAGAV